MERLEERRKVLDILDKMQFFQGQRAGRELWNDKPIEVQQQDLDSFNKGIRDIRDYMWDLEKELEEYKKLEEQGLLLRLPCKVGDTFYSTFGLVAGSKEIRKMEVKKIEIHENGKFVYLLEFVSRRGCCYRFYNDDFGKTVFLTKEEAEKKLADMTE